MKSLMFLKGVGKEKKRSSHLTPYSLPKLGPSEQNNELCSENIKQEYIGKRHDPALERLLSK